MGSCLSLLLSATSRSRMIPLRQSPTLRQMASSVAINASVYFPSGRSHCASSVSRVDRKTAQTRQVEPNSQTGLRIHRSFMRLVKGHVLRCQNLACRCEIQAISNSIEGHSTPRCCCGSEMKRIYAPPTVTKIKPTPELLELFKSADPA